LPAVPGHARLGSARRAPVRRGRGQRRPRRLSCERSVARRPTRPSRDPEEGQPTMIQAASFVNQAGEMGFRLFTGVPCSYLKPLITSVIDPPGPEYVGAANEGAAVGGAAGADLAGRRAVVMFQNSGFGNAVNPLSSLNFPFRIPVLLIVTWRGEP